MSDRNTYKIVVAACHHFQHSALMGILEAIDASNLVQKKIKGSTLFSINIASKDGLDVTNQLGEPVLVDAKLTSIDEVDAIILLGPIESHKNNSYTNILDDQTKQWLHKQYARNKLIVANNCCVLLLAEAGILKGHRCTLAPQYYDTFHKTFPHISVQRSRTVIRDKNIITLSTLTPSLDIFIQIANDALGAQATTLFERLMIPYDKSSNQKTNDSPGRFLNKIALFLSNTRYKNITVKGLAAEMAVSERTLHRRIKQYAECSPKQFIERIHIEIACRLLRETDKQVKEIALMLGYSSDTVFRKNFSQQTGMNPTDYRETKKDKKHKKSDNI